MHDDSKSLNQLTEKIIAAAIQVHRTMGPGLLESIYEWCLTKELEFNGFRSERQKSVSVTYRSSVCEELLRFDLLVEGTVLVETKAVERILPIHKAQLLSYMRLLNVPVGLLINFNVNRLVDGVSRMILDTPRNP